MEDLRSRQASVIFAMFYTSPENPMKAIARIPAVTRAIGMPLNALGTLFSESCSRRPAKRTIARPKPSDVAKAYTVASPRLNIPSAAAAKGDDFCTTVRATPRTAQLVVMSGRKIPSAE